MKRTTYSNTKNPIRAKTIGIIGGIIGVAIMVSGLIFNDRIEFDFFIIGWFLAYGCFMLVEYRLRKVVIDEDKGVIYNNANKDYPILISNITYATFKENKKGRLRSLFIHDVGVKFMEIQTSKANAEAIMAQLLKINPSIEVRHANYL